MRHTAKPIPMPFSFVVIKASKIRSGSVGIGLEHCRTIVYCGDRYYFCACWDYLNLSPEQIDRIFGPSPSFDRYKPVKFTMIHRNPVCPLHCDGRQYVDDRLARSHPSPATRALRIAARLLE